MVRPATMSMMQVANLSWLMIWRPRSSQPMSMSAGDCWPGSRMAGRRKISTPIISARQSLVRMPLLKLLLLHFLPQALKTQCLQGKRKVHAMSPLTPEADAEVSLYLILDITIPPRSSRGETPLRVSVRLVKRVYILTPDPSPQGGGNGRVAHSPKPASNSSGRGRPYGRPRSIPWR